MTEMDIQNFIEQVIIKDIDEAMNEKILFTVIKDHNCEKMNYRFIKRKDVGLKDLQCRVHNYYLNI